jgi:glutamyl-tRNA synthetase
MTVRVRYAPSPTGDPHVGNIRTALWTFLHARRHGGQFLVRIEDTDQAREMPGSVRRILDSLAWLGVDWDEGPDIGGPFAPYTQSQRLPLYHAAAERLLASGNAYRCFCTSERLEELRAQQRAAKQPPGYDARCSTLDPTESASRAQAGEPHVIRFKMPREGTTTFRDLLRGDITVENHLLDDFVILKSDRFPTYHLAHVVDDYEMQITHVSRGDEWIPSAPRHVRINEALGYPLPVYVHTSVILGPDGGKLSKRHGAKSVLEYAEEGYLPEALFNFLAITGWSPDGATEVMTRDHMFATFDFADLAPHPSTFDMQKLEWMNGVYLRGLPERDLAEHFARWLERTLPPEVSRPLDRTYVEEIAPLVRERVKLLSDLTPLVDFFFASNVPAPPRELLLGRAYRERADDAARALRGAASHLEAVSDWRAEALEPVLRAAAEEMGEKPADLFMLCRLAVTSKPVTPPLFETMAIVGRELCLDRLRAAAAVAGS